jgi:hypothetical protein
MQKLKPYLLVYVQKDGYSHIAQTMSYSTPTNTIMVRRVPGFPGTLEEIRVDQVSPHPVGKSFKYIHYATVAGVGSFPVDMLRYDSAAPVNFTLEEKFTGPHAVMLPGMDFGEGLIVADVSDRSMHSWTNERWRSFLWSVRPLWTEKLVLSGDSEMYKDYRKQKVVP